jgi:vacuolar-type H+-ATPase subunit H
MLAHFVIAVHGVSSMSALMEIIEKEAEKIIKEAEERASKIIEEAKKRAEEILNDKSYLSELETFRKELERKLKEEVNRIFDEAKREADEIRKVYSQKLSDIVKRIAATVAGVDIE